MPESAKSASIDLLQILAREELWTLLEIGTEGVCIWDVDTDRVTWSPKLLQTLGLKQPAKTIGDILELTHTDDRAKLRAALDNVIANGGAYRVRTRVRTGPERFLPISAHGAILDANEQHGRRLLGFVIDQSDAARAKEELARSEARLRAFMDNCPEGVFIKRPDGRHIYANSAAAAICGTSKEEMIGQLCSEFFPGTVSERFSRADKQALEERRAVYTTGPVTNKQAQRRHLMDVRFPVPDIASESSLIGGFGIDITDRVEKEEEYRALDRRLQDKQRLESLGLLAGGIAHDFNNVLHTIMGNAELASAAADEANRFEHLEVVREQCSYAAKLCRQLLLYAGQGRAQMLPLDLGRLIVDSNELLDVSRHRGLALSFSVSDDLMNVHGDPVQLRQVLLNLVMNAAQAAEGVDDAQVQVRVEVRSDIRPAPLIHSWLEPAQEYVCLEVTDNGSGMTAEEARLAFEPFYSTKKSGHGLGLPTVLGIVRGHKGAISVATTPKGTTVAVYLPATVDRAQRNGPKDDDSMDLEDRTVLVVDDQPEVLNVARRMIEQLGATTFGANSAAAALELAEQLGDKLYIAVVDVTMPGMSGIQLARRLRSMCPRLHIVLTSGYAADEPLPDGAAFLRKPYSIRGMQQCIAQLVRV